MRKQIIKFLFLLLAFGYAMEAKSGDFTFTVGGIQYHYKKGYDGVRVTNYTEECSGDVVIPSTVTYNGKQYTVITIEESAFSSCDIMKTVTIPNSVISIGRKAFSSCSNLKKVIWNARSASTPGYYESPFSNCNRLTCFVFGKEVISIPDYLCYDLDSLNTIVISNSVMDIDNFAFQGCTQIESITIGEKVKWIGEWAFDRCKRLERVISKAVTPPSIWATTFDDYGMPLYVPKGCKSKYAEAKYWRNFTDIREATLYKVTANATDETMGYVTGAGEYPKGGTATLVAVPFGQNYFVRWNDGNTDNPRTITVTGDMTFTAEFAPAGSAVETLENGERGIYATGRTLHVENGGESYRVYTAVGRLVYTGNDSSVTLSAPGMYIVRTSDRSQKVAVK